MDFARKILNKYGWKDGDGLGKHSDGIVKPIKASMKFDNAGLGADQAASDFNNHWWERVFNEAASNVEIKAQKNGTVTMDLKDAEDSVEISTKGYSLKKLKKAKQSSGSDDARYHNFLQTATLTKSGDEIENPEKIAVADIAVTQYKTLTDEELFEACGGRTAHKGARHGLKLSGKLSRLERQEQELLAKMQQKAKSAVTCDESEKLAKKKKNKNKNEVQLEATNDLQHDALRQSSSVQEFTELATNEAEHSCHKSKKSKKKKHKNETVKEMASPELVDCADSSANDMAKQKKRKRKENDAEASTVSIVEVTSKKSKKAKKSGKA